MGVGSQPATLLLLFTDRHAKATDSCIPHLRRRDEKPDASLENGG